MAPVLLGALLLSLLAAACDAGQASSPSEPSRPSGNLTVLAAASLTEAFNDIAKEMESQYPGLKITFNFAGSQALRTQLEQGASADVFASADSKQMGLAQDSGVVQGTPQPFAKNKLVVIVPKRNPGEIQSFRDLAKPGLRLDLAGEAVPVGNYSSQAIAKAAQTYGADFERQVLDNVVSREENVKQVVAKVQLDEVDAGIVYASDVTQAVSKDVLMITIPDEFNQIATYPIDLTKDAGNRQAAQVFIDYVLSSEGQSVLAAHNFIPVGAP